MSDKLVLLLQQLEIASKNDPYIRENFRRIQDYFDQNNLGSGTTTINNTTIQGTSLWKDVNDTVPASSTKVVDSIPVANFVNLDYKCTVFNQPNSVTKAFDLKVIYDGSILKDVLFGKVGSIINYDINVNLNAGNMEISITNNESYDLDVSLGRLIQ